MASIIRIKRSSTSGNPGTLAAGELAYSSLPDNGSNGGDRLYIGHGTETNGDAANHEVIGGKFFTDMLDHTKGTLTANSAIVVDGDSKIDDLKVDNIQINGNTITTTDTNGDLVLNANGTGAIDASGKEIINVATPADDSDAANKKYVDDQIEAQNSLQVLTYSVDDGGGAGGTVTLSDETVKFEGGTGLSSSARTSADSDVVIFTLDDTAVTAGSYGSQTAIPTFTVDAQGRLTAAGTASISSTLTVDGDTGSNGVNLLDSDLTIAGTDPVQTAMSGTTLTISVDDATTTTKGIASFNSTNFSVSSGAVSTQDITLGTTTVTNGNTITAIAGMTQLDVDDVRLDGNVISTTDSAEGLMFLDPGGNNAITGRVIVRGDFQVDGTTTTINSTTLSVDDKNIVLADGANNSADANGAGITIAGANASIELNATSSRFDFNKTVSIDSSETLQLGNKDLSEYIDDQVNSLIVAGEGLDITYDDANGTLTFDGEDATNSNKGVASFNTANFTVTSGDVTIKEVNGGTY